MRKYTDYTEMQVRNAAKVSYTMADTLRLLNLPVKGFYYSKVRYDIKNFGIDTSHWKGMGYRKNGCTVNSLSDILVPNSRITIGRYKSRLIKEGILENKCNLCDTIEWQGKPLVLHLDHIDGDSFNNVKENLRLICPNCHSQTETYCRGLRKDKTKILKCMDCDRVLTTKAKRCPSCTELYKQIKKQEMLALNGKYPPIDDLISMVRESSYEEVGRQHNVTGAAIKKFIQRRKGNVIPRYNKRT